MTFQERIKQTNFKSPKHKFLLNLKYTAHWYNVKEAAIFKKYGLLSQHFNVMRIVLGSHPDPVSPGAIKAVMIESGRDLTRLVDKLVKLGYLNRTTCPTNRRKVDITITTRGRKVASQIDKDIFEFMDGIAKLNNDEAETLSMLLDKVRGDGPA